MSTFSPWALVFQRRLFLFLAHLGSAAVSNWLAFLLRFDVDIPPQQWELFVSMLPLLLSIRALTFYPFRLYDGLWRYTSFWDARALAMSIGASTLVFAGTVRYGMGVWSYPSSVFVIDALLLLCLVTGLRLVPRLIRETKWLGTGRKRVLIVGAGDAGAMIAREMRDNRIYGYRPIGFIDDNPNKIGHRIHGVGVLGSRESLPRIIAEQRPDVVLVAMPSAAPAAVRAVVMLWSRSISPFRLSPISATCCNAASRSAKFAICQSRICWSVFPSILTRSRSEVWCRANVCWSPAPAGRSARSYAGKSATFSPSSLVLLDRYENGLFAITNELSAAGHAFIVPLIGDITDVGQINRLFAEHRPTLVFHAAAHKHVPLMEGNPCEAVLNNVGGTRIVAEAAHRHEVDRFILISTDKAVNPVSVMGASKGVAELLVRRLREPLERFSRASDSAMF